MPIAGSYMWRDFQNLVQTVRHYRVMSPDRSVRRQVNQALRSRPCLSMEEWCRQWSSIPVELTRLLYVKLGEYSGLPMGHTRPHDRLLEDLQFPIVCWFDWGLSLCDDIYQAFGVDITDSFDERNYVTLTDLVGYLDRQLSARDAFSA